MSNSNLVNYTKISPNKTSPRNHKIDTITIHHMAGNLSVETCGNVFAKTSRKASSNYGIGSDGRIGLYVSENDRSWCSSSKSNDHRAVTIEVADNDLKKWTISDKAMNSLIKLCADICKRNGLTKMVWLNDKAKSLSYVRKSGECLMTVHRWFASTACPAEYLMSKMGYIADEVNKILGSGVIDSVTPVNPVVPSTFLVKIQVSELNIRKGAGTDYPVCGVIKKNQVFTIVETKGNWGKLKSGAGWINISGKYVSRV